jgi:hypothetical protein
MVLREAGLHPHDAASASKESNEAKVQGTRAISEAQEDDYGFCLCVCDTHCMLF